MIKIYTKSLNMVLIAIFLGGCANTISSSSNVNSSSLQERRHQVLTMKNDVLAELYKLYPHAEKQIASSPGYAVFSNANVNIIFATFSDGYGVVQEKSGKHIYMKMREAGLGLGLGVKDFRAVFIFKNKSTLDRFTSSGWEFGGHADAAAKTSDRGSAVGGETLIDHIIIYQITKSGLVLQASIKGTKYWKDDELN
jgi:lipid-binding SYLF domain-containing protein